MKVTEDMQHIPELPLSNITQNSGDENTETVSMTTKLNVQVYQYLTSRTHVGY